MLALPNQTPGLIERHGLTRDDVDRHVWTVEPDGTRLRGAAAISRALRELRQPWRGLGRLHRFTPVARAAEGLYAVVAANRSRLSRIWGDAPPFDS